MSVFHVANPFNFTNFFVKISKMLPFLKKKKKKKKNKNKFKIKKIKIKNAVEFLDLLLL
jgi:hypothetical protein